MRGRVRGSRRKGRGERKWRGMRMRKREREEEGEGVDRYLRAETKETCEG